MLLNFCTNVVEDRNPQWHIQAEVYSEIDGGEV